MQGAKIPTLTQCATCGHKISTTARRCPGCHCDAETALARQKPPPLTFEQTAESLEETVAEEFVQPPPQQVDEQIAEEVVQAPAASQVVPMNALLGEDKVMVSQPSTKSRVFAVVAGVVLIAIGAGGALLYSKATENVIEQDESASDHAADVTPPQPKPTPAVVPNKTGEDAIVAKQEPTPAPLSSELSAAAGVNLDSAAAWTIHRRRIEALVASQNTDALSRYIDKLGKMYPKNVEFMYCELAEAHESMGNYQSADAIYREMLQMEPGPTSVSKAMWFFATAPDPFSDVDRAFELGLFAKQTHPIEQLASAALIEVCLKKQDQECAEAELAASKSSDYSRIYKARFARGDYSPSNAPRLVAASPHRVPGDYSTDVSIEAFSSSEKLILAENVAIKSLRAKDYDRAAGFYKELIAHADNDDVRMTFELGYGKVLETANKGGEALNHYNSLMALDWPPIVEARLLNRLAWFLLKSKTQKDVGRAATLAERAAKLTDNTDPSILDTWAEVFREERDELRFQQLLAMATKLDSKPYYQRRLEEAGGNEAGE